MATSHLPLSSVYRSIMCTTVGQVAVPSTTSFSRRGAFTSVVLAHSYWRSLSPISLPVIHLTYLVRCPLSWVNGAGLMLPLRPVPTGIIVDFNFFLIGDLVSFIVDFDSFLIGSCTGVSKFLFKRFVSFFFILSLVCGWTE